MIGFYLRRESRWKAATTRPCRLLRLAGVGASAPLITVSSMTCPRRPAGWSLLASQDQYAMNTRQSFITNHREELKDWRIKDVKANADDDIFNVLNMCQWSVTLHKIASVHSVKIFVVVKSRVSFWGMWASRLIPVVYLTRRNLSLNKYKIKPLRITSKLSYYEQYTLSLNNKCILRPWRESNRSANNLYATLFQDPHHSTVALWSKNVNANSK